MCPCPQEKTEQENKANREEVSAGWSLMTTTLPRGLRRTKSDGEKTRSACHLPSYQCCFILHVRAAASCKTKQISHTETDMLYNRGFSQRILNIV